MSFQRELRAGFVACLVSWQMTSVPNPWELSRLLPCLAQAMWSCGMVFAMVQLLQAKGFGGWQWRWGRKNGNKIFVYWDLLEDLLPLLLLPLRNRRWMQAVLLQLTSLEVRQISYSLFNTSPSLHNLQNMFCPYSLIAPRYCTHIYEDNTVHIHTTYPQCKTVYVGTSHIQYLWTYTSTLHVYTTANG